MPGPAACVCCSSTRLAKLGEDVTETLEVVPRGWKVIVRLAARPERSAPLVRDLENWMHAERARLSRHADVAKAMDTMLKRQGAFARFLEDGRVCLTNNAAERALRPIALGRKAWLFAGSDRGGERAALTYTQIQTARLNDVDSQAWLADVLARTVARRSGCEARVKQDDRLVSRRSDDGRVE